MADPCIYASNHHCSSISSIIGGVAKGENTDFSLRDKIMVLYPKSLPVDEDLSKVEDLFIVRYSLIMISSVETVVLPLGCYINFII